MSLFSKKSQSDLEERYGEASLEGYKDGQWVEPLQKIMHLEEEGLAEASVALGQFAQAKNRERALDHFKKAAKAGLAEGAWGYAAILGHNYYADIYGEDEEWYTYCLKAAKGGCSDAMNELGNVFSRKKNYLSSFYWYQMAGYYGHPHGTPSAEVIVKKWTADGCPKLRGTIDGVHRDESNFSKIIMEMLSETRKVYESELHRYLETSLKSNSHILGLFLGYVFEELLHDDVPAKIAYQSAAQNNCIMGMKCLGDMLAVGKGCERDMAKALEWYKQAAELGERTAAFIMGEYYRTTNKNLAAYWYVVADRRGFDPAFDRIRQLV